MRANLFLLLGLLFFAAACGGGDEDGPPAGLANADILRDTDSALGEYLNDPALTSVTREFGPSVVNTASLPFRSALVQSATKPWSAWWYPKRDMLAEAETEGSLLGALAKYDEFRRARYGITLASARDFEAESSDPSPFSWEGLCDAWSLAAISVPEPTHPVTVMAGGRPLTFSVGDLKALLLKTFEAVDEEELQYYGQKFTGNNSGWVYPDIFPEQFHRLVEVQLFENKQAFVMDHDAGVQIWNVPVFKANYTMESVPNEPDSVFVRTWLYSAESTASSQRNFVGTKEAVREYNYVLRGKRNDAGELEIASGYWTTGPSGINSRTDHPDFLFRPIRPRELTRKSWNPEIDPAVVDEILSKAHGE